MKSGSNVWLGWLGGLSMLAVMHDGQAQITGAIGALPPPPAQAEQPGPGVSALPFTIDSCEPGTSTVVFYGEAQDFERIRWDNDSPPHSLFIVSGDLAGDRRAALLSRARFGDGDGQSAEAACVSDCQGRGARALTGSTIGMGTSCAEDGAGVSGGEDVLVELSKPNTAPTYDRASGAVVGETVYFSLATGPFAHTVFQRRCLCEPTTSSPTENTVPALPAPTAPAK